MGICLINVYLPCRGGSHTEAEYGSALDMLSAVVEKYKVSHHVIILGDFNASLVDDRGSRDNKFTTWCISMGISLTPGYPLEGTYIHRHGDSLIDYVLSLNHAILKDISLLKGRPDNTSPHIPVTACLTFNSTLPTQEKPASFKPSINWKKCDMEEYQTLIQKLLPSFSDLDGVCPQPYNETLTEVLLFASESSAPRLKAPKKQSWNGEVSRAMAINKAALQQWNKDGCPHQGPQWDARKDTKRRLQSALRQANAEKRHCLYREVMTASTRDNRLFHKLINRQKTTIAHAGSRLLVNGELLNTRTEMLPVWTKHFSDLATHQQPEDTVQVYDNIITEELLVMNWSATNNIGIPISPDEVSTALRCLKPDKAPDVLGLKAEHLKNAGHTFTAVLANIFNAELQHGLSTYMRNAYISPVHKKGKDPLNLDHYRGITITPILSKTMEHIFLNRLKDNLHQNSLQFGFTKGLSPALAVLAVTESIADAADCKSSLYLLALDVRKAFDVVRCD